MIFFEYISNIIKSLNDYLLQVPYISSYLNEIFMTLSLIFIFFLFCKSRILEKYLIKELAGPFIITLFTITFVLLLDQIMDMLNLIIEKNLDFLTIINVFALAIPFLLALSIPMSVLMSTILAFGRLSVDRELVAMKSGGVNIFRATRPIYIMALLLSLFMIYFNNKILPETNHKFSNLRVKISMKKPMKIITPGEYIDFGKYTVMVNSVSEDEMQGIIIYDRSTTQFPKTIVAERGKIIPIPQGNSLKAVLYNGEMHERDTKKGSKYRVSTFQEFNLNILDLQNKVTINDRKYRGDREMSSEQLVASIREEEEKIALFDDYNNDIKEKIAVTEDKVADSENKKLLRRKINSYRNKIEINNKEKEYSEERIRNFLVEYHKKFAMSFACLIFCLLGVPIGIMTKSSGIGSSFSVSAVIFLVYYVALIGGERLADKGLVDAGLSMWISNIIFTVVAIFLTYRAKYESSLIDFSNFNLSKLKLKKRVSNEKA